MGSEKNGIRNLGFFGHGGAGKTTLTEGILFASGITKRMGSIEEGSTVSDFDEEEVRRQISINCSVASFDQDGTEMVILDTPGYADFIGDAISAIRVVDSCGIVVSGVDGVEVQTEIMGDHASSLSLPTFFFVSKLDRERASFERAVGEIQEIFGQNAVPLNMPIGAESDLKGIVNLLNLKAYAPDGIGKTKEIPLPDEISDAAKSYNEKLIEVLAEVDDVLLEKYLEEGSLDAEELETALKSGILGRKIFPVLCGSAVKGIGICEFLDFVSSFLPAPHELPEIWGVVPGDDKNVSFPRTKEAPLSALVFKTMADPYVGKLTYFRVFSGKVESDSTVFNSSKKTTERLGQLYKILGKNQKPVDTLVAGEIGGVAKLAETATGDTLCTKENPVIIPRIEYLPPSFSLAVEPKTKGDEDKLSTALGRLQEEDPMLRVSRDTEVNQTIVSGAGEAHLEVAVGKLRRKFGVDVVTEAPKVPYKETIRKKVEAEGKYKKQTGGHGQYGHCFLKIEPLPRGEGVEFENKVVGGAIPRQYIPGVEKGVTEAMRGGYLAGYPMVDMKVTVYDGTYHPVDSSELAFKMAASKALKEGVSKAEPVILEPIADVEVTVPEDCMGDVIGDLNSKRGRILGVQPKSKMQVVRAQVPVSEMSRYSIDLRSITGGRGIYKMEFSHYEEAPEHVAEKIIAQRKKEEES